MAKLATSAVVRVDPVCGMEVVPGKTRLVTIYRGQNYWFCHEGCHRTFQMNPRKYLERKRSRRKGCLGRYLDRVAKANRDQVICDHVHTVIKRSLGGS
jgi:YHS domain-containing protein